MLFLKKKIELSFRLTQQNANHAEFCCLTQPTTISTILYFESVAEEKP
jgi:hypothetical protein